MMPVALAMVWLELKLCSWLFVEVENVNPHRHYPPTRGDFVISLRLRIVS